jgi:hypothetical protein
MDNSTLLSIILGLAIVGYLLYILVIQPKKVEPITNAPRHNSPLQLQAYERLILLVDRIALPNLISRTPSQGLSASEMQFVLTKNIREEFDYNVTQQIYVTPEAWNALKNLKEKNILYINQVAQELAPEATGMDLQKYLLNFLVNEPKANLHELVSEALSFEAKKYI